MGMGMTEKQGGSDVRANTTRAEPDGDDAWGQRYRHHRPQVVLLGADVRRLPGAGADARRPELLLPAALCCPTARSTPSRIQRLKDKLGNHANASSEVEFDGATAWLVGEEGRGVPQILEMGTHDAARLRARHRRPDAPGAVACAAPHRAAPGLRQAPDRPAADEERAGRPGAGNRSRHRAGAAPGARLRPHRDDRDEHEARDAPRCSRRSPSSGSASAAATSRRRPWNAWAATAMSKSGRGVMARIYREMPLNSIWEGAGNIMALDLLRALRRRRRGRRLAARTRAGARRARRAGPHSPTRCLRRHRHAWPTKPQARRLAQDVALAVQAALLHRSAPARCSRPSAIRAWTAWGRRLRHAAGRAPISTPSSHAPCPPEPLEVAPDDRPDPAPLPESPFAEKVRLMLGFKELAWRSVTIPVVMPKPDVVALTGGYRRTPLLQIGADIYCDTALIARVLDAATHSRRCTRPAAPLARAAGAMGRRHAVLGRRTRAAAGRPGHVLAGAPPEVLKAFAADRAGFTPACGAAPADATAQLMQHLRPGRAAAQAGPFCWARRPHRRLRGRPSIWFMRLAPPVADLLDDFPPSAPGWYRLAAFGPGAHDEEHRRSLARGRPPRPHAPAASSPAWASRRRRCHRDRHRLRRRPRRGRWWA